MPDESEDDNEIVVSFRTTEALVDDFMQSYRMAQAQGFVSPSGDRSEALRAVMEAAANDPEVFSPAEED